MPIIQVDVPKLSKAQKAQLVSGVTEVVSKATSLPANAITVIIRENDSDNVGVAGQLLSDRK